MRLRGFAVTLLAGLLASPTWAARPDTGSAFSQLAGTWSGSGQIRLEGGRTEALRCRASYTDHNDGASLGISLRCASASNKVDLHAQLKAAGTRVSGAWEERQFNAAGSAAGTASGNQIILAISGGGLEGSMHVTTNGSRQSVSIETQNVALKGIQIALARD